MYSFLLFCRHKYTPTLLLQFACNLCIMTPMNMNIVGLVVSFPFLGLVIALGIWLRIKFHISSEMMRKFVHIGVSNWWFIEVFFFDSISYALVGPICFILVNSLFTFLDLGKSLGMDDRKRNYGLIYFPVSLLVLIILQYNHALSALAASIAALVMGYADGFAALAGTKWGAKKLPFGGSRKSYAGTIAMALISCIIALVALVFFSSVGAGKAILLSLIIGLVASIVEAITPLGLDNLTVPLVVALITEVLL